MDNDEYRVFEPNTGECPVCGWPCNREYGDFYCTNPGCEGEEVDRWKVSHLGSELYFQSFSDAQEYALTEILASYTAWEKLQDEFLFWDPNTSGTTRWSRLLPDGKYLRVEKCY